MKSLFSVLRWVLLLPLRLVRALPRTILALIIVASLALNVATLTISGLYAVASGALSAVGISTVAAREAGEKLATRTTTRKIGRETARNVTRRVQRGAARNISSVAGEAIPIAGIAVIAGALTLEVKDACDTAAEMAGLEAALETSGDPESARKEAIEAFNCSAMIREELPDYDDLPTRDEIWASVKSAPGAAYQKAEEAGISLAEFDWSGSAGRVFETPKDMIDDLVDWMSGAEEPAQ